MEVADAITKAKTTTAGGGEPRGAPLPRDVGVRPLGARRRTGRRGGGALPAPRRHAQREPEGPGRLPLDPADRRARLVCLTPKGAKLRDAGTEQIKQIEQDWQRRWRRAGIRTDMRLALQTALQEAERTPTPHRGRPPSPSSAEAPPRKASMSGKAIRS